MSAATQSQPDPLTIVENAPPSHPSAGNGVLVNGSKPFGGNLFPPFNSASGRVAGSFKKAKIHRNQAEIVADTCFQMIVQVRQTMGLGPTVKPVTKPIIGQTPNPSDNGQSACESVSIQSAPPPAMEITRDHAQIVGLLTRGWDTALERLRVLKGVPDPGCRRPGEPIPKARKPANRAPDSLACGSDTPTGSVPLKG